MASMDENKAPSTFVLILIALLGGGSTNLAGRFIAPPRVDPWTGEQARTEHTMLRQGIEDNRERLNAGVSREHQTIRSLEKQMGRLRDDHERLRDQCLTMTHQKGK